jgi:hypothetical protein
MADTIRETIINAIKTGLTNNGSYEAIAPSPTVVRGFLVFDASVYPLPVISIMPGIEDAQREEYGVSVNTMEIDIWCSIMTGQDEMSEIGEAILGELVKAFWASVPTGIRDYSYTGGGPSYPDGIAQKVLMTLASFNVVYETDLGDPYNLSA